MGWRSLNFFSKRNHRCVRTEENLLESLPDGITYLEASFKENKTKTEYFFTAMDYKYIYSLNAEHSGALPSSLYNPRQFQRNPGKPDMQFSPQVLSTISY